MLYDEVYNVFMPFCKLEIVDCFWAIAKVKNECDFIIQVSESPMLPSKHVLGLSLKLAVIHLLHLDRKWTSNLLLIQVNFP